MIEILNRLRLPRSGVYSSVLLSLLFSMPLRWRGCTEGSRHRTVTESRPFDMRDWAAVSRTVTRNTGGRPSSPTHGQGLSRRTQSRVSEVGSRGYPSRTVSVGDKWLVNRGCPGVCLVGTRVRSRPTSPVSRLTLTAVLTNTEGLRL